MSDREIDINLTPSTTTSLTNAPPSDAEKAQYKAKLAQVLERGIVVDMLQVPLPSDVHGEWCSRDPNAITRLEILGYKVDTEYATKKSLNDHGDGSAVVGDVIFMTIPKWKKQMIDDVARQRYYETHIKDKRKQKEERDFEAANRGIGMPLESGKGSLVGSSTAEVDGSSIVEALSPQT
jgi:hypothetical protein